MIVPGDANPLLMGGADGYQISRSVRFRSGATAYFSRTPASASNRTTWTWSGWVKRGDLSRTQGLFGAGVLGNNANFQARWHVDNTLYFQETVQNISNQLVWVSTPVYRDCSSWYHVVIAMDTTQATAADRAKAYVNGVQVAGSFTVTPSQNQATSINNNVPHYLGAATYNLSPYLVYPDSYMAEVNFIDGQALTPSSFGETDAVTGVWKPKKYAGTYGTNGFYLPFSLNAGSTYGASFNGSSQYLTTSTNSSLALGTNSFTVEYWLYISSNTGGAVAVTSGNGTSTYDGLFGYQTGSQSLILYLTSTGSSWDVASGVTIGSTPTGTWNHVAITRNGSTFYTFVNGVQGATFTSSASLYQSANSFTMGRAQSGTILNGYLSNVRVVVGTALYTSNFVPPTSALTAVTNTKLLTLQDATIVDNSTNALTFTNTGSVTTSTQYPFANPTIGADASGNANEWLPNNINVTTTGVTYDSMVDSPTPYGSDTGAGGTVRGNYCVMNPVAKNSRVSSITGNLQVYGDNTSNHQIIYGTFPITTGKWYWEVAVNNPTTSTVNIVGIQSYIGFADNTYCGGGGNGIGWGYTTTIGNFYSSNFTVSGTAPALANGTIGIAYDADAGKIWFKNTSGSWVQGDPAAGTSPTGTLSGTATTMMPAVSFYNSNGAFDFNFGQRAFAYTAPSGYKALCTQNLPTPTIANGAGYMAATLWNGTGVTQNIANTVGSVSFQPDFVWNKSRSNAAAHILTDSVRGVNKQLYSDLTNTEATLTDQVTAFLSNGFTVGADTNGGTNYSGRTYVGWQWKAGAGSSSSNTDGNRTSTVSANPTAGFSVVTWTFSTSANNTIGHGLGVAPSFIIVKDRSAAVNWDVYHVSLGYTQRLILNSTGGAVAGYFAAAPTSTVFSMTTAAYTNNDNIVAYCFAPIAGYSAFGSYTGNGSTDGPFVYTGFRPRFVLVKISSGSARGWSMWDTSRDIANGDSLNARLEANTSAVEDTGSGGGPIDILSNGFKIRNTAIFNNESGSTFIYAAFAENPFRHSLAR